MKTANSNNSKNSHQHDKNRDSEKIQLTQKNQNIKILSTSQNNKQNLLKSKIISDNGKFFIKKI